MADIYFGNGRHHVNMALDGGACCSDLNTMQFLLRVIEAERSDLIAESLSSCAGQFIRIVLVQPCLDSICI